MHVALHFFSTPYTAHPADVARKAEEIGFESIWMGEHPIMPVTIGTPYPFRDDGQIPDFYSQIADPFIGLASAAAVTTRIKLATGVCLVPEHNPLILAKQVATLDHYSGGRVILGVGAGWLREEAQALGTDFSRRWLLLREGVEAMRELWTRGEAEYQGKAVSFPAVRCIPQPVQKPYPPSLLGTHGEKGLQRVARWADGWCPMAPAPEELRENLKLLKRLTQDAGRDFSKLDIAVFLGVTAGTQCGDMLKRYEDAGAHRAILFLGHQEGLLAFSNVHFFRPAETDGILERLGENSITKL